MADINKDKDGQGVGIGLEQPGREEGGEGGEGAVMCPGAEAALVASTRAGGVIAPNQQSLRELRRAVAFHDQIEANVAAGEGVTALAARTYACKWLVRAARAVVLHPGDYSPRGRLDS